MTNYSVSTTRESFKIPRVDEFLIPFLNTHPVLDGESGVCEFFIPIRVVAIFNYIHQFFVFIFTIRVTKSPVCKVVYQDFKDNLIHRNIEFLGYFFNQIVQILRHSQYKRLLGSFSTHTDNNTWFGVRYQADISCLTLIQCNDIV